MTGKAREITLALGGIWYGRYGLVPGFGHSRRDRSVCIKAHPTDPTDLIVHSFAGDDWRDFKETLRSQGLLPARAHRKADGRDHACFDVRSNKARLKDAEDALRTAKKVRRILAESTPIDGTAADLYLQNRGLKPPFPGDLRYHSNLWTVGRYGKPICSAAMVALVRRAPGGKICAVHRTFLTATGSKNPNVEKVKRMLGPCKGGAVWPDVVDEALAISEGIETALSFTKMMHTPCASALSAGFIKAVRVPPRVRDLTIGADNDLNGVGLREGLKAANRLHRPWRHTQVVMPPTAGQDFNDVLIEGERNHG
jgi:phage/plasmid primase-like uncharacterized protein